MKQLIIIISLLTLSACSSSNKQEKQMQPEEVSTKNFELSDHIKNVQQLPINGESSHPVFTNDGKHFLFQSRNRSRHEHFQIYEYDLSSTEEKRITHQHGSAYHANFNSSNSKIVYTSTTDKEKENPELIARYKNNFKDLKYDMLNPSYLSSDIYSSKRDGSEIIRFSTAIVAADFANFKDASSNIIFLEFQKGGDAQLKEINRFKKKLKAQSIVKKPKALFKIRRNSDWDCNLNSTSELICKNSKNKKEFKNKDFVQVHSLGLFEDDQLLISAKTKANEQLQLYWFKLSENCNYQLAESKENWITPSLQPSQKELYFSRETEDGFRIAKAEFNSPQCSKEEAQEPSPTTPQPKSQDSSESAS